jgi:predicted N-acetyltransferase YhbS
MDYLAHHPEFVPALAQETLDHYRDILRDETLETRCVKLRSYMQIDSLPLALVACADGELLGMGVLREHDLPGHDELTPWLGGMFVRPQHRRRGIGSAICHALEEKAWLMGFPVLYLFTLDQRRLYTRLGWQHVQPSSWRGHAVDIMMKHRPKTPNQALQPTGTRLEPPLPVP